MFLRFSKIFPKKKLCFLNELLTFLIEKFVKDFPNDSTLQTLIGGRLTVTGPPSYLMHQLTTY